ncbi:PAS domain S-box-containing protein [Elusimicrobium posterum]|uniref:PAS domain S-box protein n=1 Tax=Elusimicrobium posterum TaxID=3116653 RepID=UPI003C72AED5
MPEAGDGRTAAFSVYLNLINYQGSQCILYVFESTADLEKSYRDAVNINNFLKTLLDNAPFGLYARDTYGRYLIKNRKTAELFGGSDVVDVNNILTLYETAPKDPGEYLLHNPAHETQEQIEAYLNREGDIFQSGKTVDIPYEEYEKGDGTKTLVHLIKTPVRSADGQILGVLTFAEDIEDRVNWEKENLETKNFLQSVLESAPIAIFAKDTDGDIMFYNKAADDLFQITHLQQNHPGEKTEPILFDQAADQKIIETKAPMTLPEEKYVNHGGREYRLHIIKAPVLNTNGTISMVLTIAEDVTQRYMQEQETISAKNFLTTVVNNIPVALLAKNHKGEYILWNKKSEELFGYKMQEVVGKKFYQTNINPDLKEYIEQQDKMVFDARKEIDIPQEIISTAKEGAKILHTVKTPVYTAEGRPDYMLSISDDITHKIKMEKQLKESREKYSMLVENAQEGIAILEGKKLIFANTPLAKMLGFENADAMMGASLENLVAGDYKVFYEDIYVNAKDITTGEKKIVDIRFNMQEEDEFVDLETYAVSSKYMGKKTILMFFRDVTQQNRVFKDLRTEKDRFKTGFEKYPYPMGIMSYNGYISALNEQCRSIFKLKPEDSKYFKLFYFKSLLPLHVRRLMRRGEPAVCKFVFDPKFLKGTPFEKNLEDKISFDLQFVPISKKDSKDGSIFAEYLIVMDRSVKEDNGPGEEYYANILLNGSFDNYLFMNMPTMRCGTDGKIEEVNAAFCRMTEENESAFTGKNIMDIFSDEHRRVVACDLQELFRNKFFLSRYYNLKISSANYLSVAVDAFRLKEGGFVVTFRNETPHTQILDVLQERSERIEELFEAVNGAAFIFPLINYSTGGNFTQVNKEALGFGFTYAQLLDKSLASLMAPEGTQNTAPLQTEVDAHIKKLINKDKVRFNTKIYNAKGHEILAEISLRKINISKDPQIIAVVKDISSMVKTSSASNGNMELESLKRAIPGFMLKTDSEGYILEAYSNSKDTEFVNHISRYQYKHPYDFLPKETADNLVFSVKEALAANTTVEFTFNIDNEEEGFRSFEASVSPMREDDKAVILFKEITNRREMELKIQRLYNITVADNGDFTKSVDNILNFGKRVFNTDVGFIMRFGRNKKNGFNVIYASDNELNIKKGMYFDEDVWLKEIKEGNVYTTQDSASENENKKSFSQLNGARNLIAGPLVMGGKITGALVFAGQNKNYKFKEGDSEFMALMARLLSLGIELREAGKIVSQDEERLERTLKHLGFPVLAITPSGEITFVNQKFKSVVGKENTKIIGENFFNKYTAGPHMAKQNFFKALDNADNYFEWEQGIVGEDQENISADWNVSVVRDSSGEAVKFVLIAATRE